MRRTTPLKFQGGYLGNSWEHSQPAGQHMGGPEKGRFMAGSICQVSVRLKVGWIGDRASEHVKQRTEKKTQED